MEFDLRLVQIGDLEPPCDQAPKARPSLPPTHFSKPPTEPTDTSAFNQGVAASCPDTKIVLGGYSQGAAVIDIVTVAV